MNNPMTPDEIIKRLMALDAVLSTARDCGDTYVEGLARKALVETLKLLVEP